MRSLALAQRPASLSVANAGHRPTSLSSIPCQLSVPHHVPDMPVHSPKMKSQKREVPAYSGGRLRATPGMPRVKLPYGGVEAALAWRSVGEIEPLLRRHLDVTPPLSAFQGGRRSFPIPAPRCRALAN